MTYQDKSFQFANSPQPESGHAWAGGARAEHPASRSVRPGAAVPGRVPSPRFAGLGPFDQLELTIEAPMGICWAFMRPHARACFSTDLLREIRRLQRGIRGEAERRQDAGEAPLKYIVFGSRVPGVFNLGGDLGLFGRLIRTADRAGLQQYAELCVDVVYDAAIGLDLPVVTIALVQGDALGGGLEAALACNLIVAEKSAKFGLPEVLFNLFPGMGAYNFLSRRLDVARAERIILSGRVFSADEMLALGVIDLVVEDGFGEEAVRDYVERNLRRHSAQRAVYAARQLLHPVRLTELRTLAELWVDTALRLTDADLRKMSRLAVAQERRRQAGSHPHAVAAE